MKRSKSKEQFDPEEYFTIQELLNYLKNQYSKWTIYKWVGEGMPHVKVRGKLWFPKRDVLDWLKRS